MERRGVDEMDDYVTDAIGIGYETSAGKKLSKEINSLAMWAFFEFIHEPAKDESILIEFELMQSMYIFGMVYEMERLGMR